MSFNWTDEKAELCKTLWVEGRSCSQIAAALNCGVTGFNCVTRNGVIGKIHRMKWQHLRNGNVSVLDYAPGNAPPPMDEIVKVARKKKKEVVDVEPEPARQNEDGSHASTIEVHNENDCAWPIGDPDAPDFHYCGNARKPGRPYCEGHCRKAYQSQQTKRKALTHARG